MVALSVVLQKKGFGPSGVKNLSIYLIRKVQLFYSLVDINDITYFTNDINLQRVFNVNSTSFQTMDKRILPL